MQACLWHHSMRLVHQLLPHSMSANATPPAGTSGSSGVIPDLFPSLSFPLPWYLGRTAMLTWFIAAVAPLLLARTLGGLARVSAFKVTCVLLCTLALVVLTLAAALQGVQG